MEEIEVKKKKSRPVALLFTIPALLFGIISMALSVVGLGLIPIVPAIVGLLLCAVSWFLFQKSYRIYTLIVVGVSVISIVVSFFRGVIIETKVAQDANFDSAITQAQQGIDSDLVNAFGDEGFDDVPFDTVVAPVVVVGQEIYINKCSVCHMANGLGIENTYPPLAGSDYLKNIDKTIGNVLFGSKGGSTVNGKVYNLPEPALDLTDQEATDVLHYILTSWGNSFEPVTIEQVQAVRASRPKK